MEEAETVLVPSVEAAPLTGVEIVVEELAVRSTRGYCTYTW